MNRFKNILCVLGDNDDHLLDRAIVLAEANKANLTVMDVVPKVQNSSLVPQEEVIYSDIQAAMLLSCKTRLEKQIARHQKRLNIRLEVAIGIPFLMVTRQVLRHEHDLVMKCPESPGWLDRLFNGNDMQLLSKCPCPVWMIKALESKSVRRVLAAIDVSTFHATHELDTNRGLNLQIIETAASLALSDSAELHIAYAWESMTDLVNDMVRSSDRPKSVISQTTEQELQNHQSFLDSALHNIERKSAIARDALYELQPQTHVLQGSARRVIPKLAKNLAVDCIVMGTVGRTGISGFLIGNTAETILAQIDTSVLAIKPEQFATSVSL